MSKRRGNTSSYKNLSKADQLEKAWRNEVTRPTLHATYDKLRSAEFADVSVKGRDIARGLDFLAEATDDEAFWTAALAIRAYGFDKGGLKTSTLKMLRDNQRTADWAAIVGGDQQARRHGQAKRLRRSQVDNRFEHGRGPHRKVGGLVAAQDAVDIGRRLPGAGEDRVSGGSASWD
jgi:hypothetical protein